MTTLAKAPLIEVVTEIRWGSLKEGADVSLSYEFPPEEQTTFPARIEEVLREGGFVFPEEIALARELEDVPFAISRRYRKSEDDWPVVQTGLGVATVNQTNEHYDWDHYKDLVLDWFELVDKALRIQYPAGIPYIGIELTYLDGFILDEGETPAEFLKKKMRVRLRAPDAFLEAPFLAPERTFTAAGLSFEIGLQQPPGLQAVSLQYDPHVLNRPGFIMETRVRTFRDALEYDHKGIADWLEAAHVVQQHAFKTLIEPAYRESFQ